MADVNRDEPYGSISPWETSPLMEGEGFGEPQWLRTLSDVWSPHTDKEGNITNIIKKHLEPQLMAHEEDHEDSHAMQPAHMGSLTKDIGHEGGSPSELYEKHFQRWMTEAATKEQRGMDEMKQRKQHLDTYKDVWAGKERDPLDPYDEGDHSLGHLAYGFGLEWLSPSQRDDVIAHLDDYGLMGHDKHLLSALYGEQGDGRKMPHIPQPWLTRNWMGRLAGNVFHSIRGMDSTGSQFPAPYYDPQSFEVKEYQKRRHLMEAMKDSLVYQDDAGKDDLFRPGTKAGQLAHGYFDEDPNSPTHGQWFHDEGDERSGPVFHAGTRDISERFLNNNQRTRAGVYRLSDHIGAKADPEKKNAKGEVTHQGGTLPRLVHTYDKDKNSPTFGEITSSNLQVKGHRIDNDNPFSSIDEFNEYLNSGHVDEDQHAHVSRRANEIGEEFDRRRQVLNHLAPLLSMYYYGGGDKNNVKISPYAHFMLPSHARGGHGANPNTPLGELHHIYGPDKEEGDGWHKDAGLFTQWPGQKTQGMYVMQLGEDDEPQNYPEDIWPREAGRDPEEGDFREESMEQRLPLGNVPRDEMLGLLGWLADQPVDKMRDYGGIANIQSGANKHWPQLITSHEQHVHDEHARDDETGAIRLGMPGTRQRIFDDEGLPAEDSATRTTMHHMLSAGGLGRKRDKKRGLMNKLMLGWDAHPSTAAEIMGHRDALGDVVGEGGRTSGRLGKWVSALMKLGSVFGSHMIPGDPREQNLKSRVQQFLMHTGLDKQPISTEEPDVAPTQDKPLPLVEPRSEEYERRGRPTREDPRRPQDRPQHLTGPTDEPWGGRAPPEEVGWLPEGPPAKWSFWGSAPSFNEQGEWEGDYRRHPEELDLGGGKSRLHSFDFQYQSEAINAVNTGEVPCPVCGGDGHIDPEDIGKAEKAPDLFGGADDEDEPKKPPPDLFGTEPAVEMKVGEECPNCHGTGKHKLSEGLTQEHIGPELPEHHQEMATQQRIEDLHEQYQKATEAGLSGREILEDIERLEGQLQFGIRTPSMSGEKYSDYHRGGGFKAGHEYTDNNYHMQKLESTVNHVRQSAGQLAEQVRKQFADDGLPDPFGPDEDGDWSQGHVNALQLWRYANEWIQRAQPSVRSGGPIFGLSTDASANKIKEGEVPAGAAVYYPELEEGLGVQTKPMSIPMSIYNSDGYRNHFGWKMAPSFGMNFDTMGNASVMHNDGDVSSKREPLLNVPFEDITSVFPEMQPMSNTHTSAPAGGDEPETQKVGEDGQNWTFRLSEDDPIISDIVKSMTNPDLLKEDARFRPIKAAHRIFDLKDLENLRGFSGDWVVSTWWKGKRAIVRKKGKTVNAQYADGSSVRLTNDRKIGIRDANSDDFMLDVMVAKNGYIDVIDLLEHDNKELYDEPLKDRLRKLRSDFDSTDDVRFPAPFNTRRTDDEGLADAIENLSEEESDGYLLRDANSAYMKGESRHPKWILFCKPKIVDFIILNRRGRGPYTYRLGVGPINSDKANVIGNRATERDKKWYMDVGTLVRERKAFNEGDHVQVRVSSVSHRRRKGEDIYTVQPTRIVSESETEGTDSVDTLSLLAKSLEPILFSHDVVVSSNKVKINLLGLKDTVIYKIDQWPEGWAIHQPVGIVGDLTGTDYSVHMAESLRPFWEPVVGMVLKGLVKVKKPDNGSHEEGFKIKPPKKVDDEQILKPNIVKTIIEALELIDDSLLKEKMTWTGPKALGIGLGTPDSAPRGPTELTSDENTLDYDMRPRPDEEPKKPRKKPKKMEGKPHPMTVSVSTDEKEKGKVRVTDDGASLEMQP